MEAPIFYSKAEFIETVRSHLFSDVLSPFIVLHVSSVIPQDTGNKVSRRATIAGPQNIILGGKTIISSGAIIRGDLRRTGTGHAVVISLGRYCLVGEGCIMRSATLAFLHQQPVFASHKHHLDHLTKLTVEILITIQ
jgi:hypothetical protein